MSELTEKQHRLSNTDEVANLDVLRAVAVSSVFFAHLYNFTRPDYSNTAWHFGQLGVLAFFVHTSLVLMFSLQRQQSPGGALFSSFYIRRWFRLYPLSIFFVLVAYVGHLTPEGHSLFRHWTAPELLANMSLTQNLLRKENMVGGLWTLPLEVQMYVMLPPLFLFLLRKPWPLVIGLWAASIPLAFFSVVVSDRLNVLEYVPCFLGGILAWKLSQQYRPIFPGWLWPAGLVGVSLVWFCSVNMRPYDLPLRWVFCGSLGAIIPMFHSMGNSIITRTAAIIAKYSYGIYLSHILVMTIAFRFLARESQLLRWGVFAALAVALPYLAFHLLEAPMIAVGKKLSRRAEQQPAASLLPVAVVEGTLPR